jgi:hypothetical protein
MPTSPGSRRAAIRRGEVNDLIAPQIQFQLVLPTQNYQGK